MALCLHVFAIIDMRRDGKRFGNSLNLHALFPFDCRYQILAVLDTMSTGWAANRPGADQPDVNKGPTLAAVSVALTVIASLIVSLRVWCRVRLLKSFGPDVSRASHSTLDISQQLLGKLTDIREQDWVIIGTMVRHHFGT